MPLTDHVCPNCNGQLHTDDILDRRCVTPGCGYEFETYLVPTDESDGNRYHSVNCGAHLLKRVTEPELITLTQVEDLYPCGNCCKYHGLESL